MGKMKYLVCYDGSPSSDKAMQMVKNLTKADDSVIVLSVGNYETHIWEDAAKKEEHKQQALAHAEKVVSKGTDKAAEVGLPNIDGKFVAGCPREVILHVAEENEVDVIPMGSRFRTTLSFDAWIC